MEALEFKDKNVTTETQAKTVLRDVLTDMSELLCTLSLMMDLPATEGATPSKPLVILHQEMQFTVHTITQLLNEELNLLSRVADFYD